MSSPVPPRKKPTSLRSRGSKRDPAAVRKAMLGAAGVSPIGKRRTSPDGYLLDPQNHMDVGLPLGKLEDQRWRVSPSVAREKLHKVGLPYEGRRAGLIYSWASIFRAEGIDEELAENATRQSHPDLFHDLVGTAEAAVLLGYQDASSIRKLVGASQLPDTAFIQFGSRGVYRFRLEALQVMRKRNSVGRIV